MQQAFATIEQVYNNPGGRTLRVVAGLACNVPDETIYANVAANAEFSSRNWLKLSPSHDGVAVLCGSGPSLTDSLSAVRELQDSGAKVFALNGAAEFLARRKVIPDYQVMMDAKPESVSLIGPAKHYLFASQLDPSCFKRRPYAQLWHSTHGEWIPEFPDHPEDYCVIAGSVTVGNTALALAYAMGYRDIHCFGYDSSHRGTEGHAFSQPMNASDACVATPFMGKYYVSSYAMKLQADTFVERAKQLEGAGCKITVEGDGLLPAMWRARFMPLEEREKYRLMWQHAEYRAVSPGEQAVGRFLSLENERGQILDVGCGTGRASIALKAAGFSPMLIDFADNSRDADAIGLPFLCRDLARDRLPASPFGFCADVMEHLPTEEVPGALANILSSCERVFFTISTVPDSMGSLIAKDLHLTVKPYAWWRDRIREAGGEIEYAETQEDAVIFYARSTVKEST